MAAAVCDWPETSSTSSTGRPNSRGKVGRRARAPRLAQNAVEQAHGALDDHQIRILSSFAGERRRAASAAWPSCRD